MGQTELREVAYLRRDKGVFSRDLTLLDRVSDLTLILRADIPTRVLNQGPYTICPNTVGMAVAGS